MKKLIIATAVAIVGFALNAADYKWSSYSNYIAENPESEGCAYAGFAVYTFNANVFSSASLISALDSGDKTAFENAMSVTWVDGESWTFLDNETKSGVMMPSYTKEDTGATEYMNGYWVIVDAADAADASRYYVNDVFGEQVVNDATKSNGYIMGADENYLGSVSSWSKIESVPEPTSGLLLLLGVAGLALRRRRA